MTRFIFPLAFTLGAIAVGLMARNFFPSDILALIVTLVIALVYLIGGAELIQFRDATETLNHSLSKLTGPMAESLTVLDEWLIKLHPSLHHSVRQRVEGERVGLPGPVLTPYLVSLLVMLGLLGTFVGLVETLKGVVVALEGSSELEAIRQALTAPMSGLEVAFGTSVAGVAASAMLGLMSTLSRRERMLATRKLDSRIATDLRHFSLSHQRRETFNALQLQSEALPNVAGKLQSLMDHMERMGDQMNRQLVANQQSFHDSTKVMYQDLASSLKSSLRESMAKTDSVLSESGRLIGEGIQPIMQEAMTEIGSQIGRSVEDTHQQLRDAMQSQLQALSDRLIKTSDKVAQTWQQGLAVQQDSSEAMTQRVQTSFDSFREEFGQTTTAVIASIDETTKAWSERQHSNEKEQMAQWTASLQQTHEQESDQLKQLVTSIIGELRAASETHQAAIVSQSDELALVYSKLTTQLRESNESAATRQKTLTEELDASTRAVVDSSRSESSRMLSEMNALLSASENLVQARVSSEKSWLESQEMRIQHLATTLRQELSALRDDEAQRVEAAAGRMDALENTVSTHLASLGQALEEPMTRLIEVASETPRAAAEVIGKLRQEISNNIKRDNQLLEERGQMMTELEAVSESLASSTAAQVVAIEKLVDTSGERLDEISEHFKEQVESKVSKVSEVIDHFAVSTIEMSSFGEAFSVAIDLYSESNNQLASSMQSVKASLEGVTARSDEQLGYYIAQARELIDYSVLTQKEIFDELRQLKIAASDPSVSGEIS